MSGHKGGRRWAEIFQQKPEHEVDDELRFHTEQRIREYIQRGMTPEAAKQAVAERMGDLTPVHSECTALLAADRKAQKRRIELNISWLDVKLGARMLRKYPGLSIVSVIGLALAIAIGAGYFAFFGMLLDPTVPLADGDRIVSIRNRDRADAGFDATASLADFITWRDEVGSVQDLGAFRDDSRNLIMPDGSTHLVRVAVMTASGFRLTRVSPMLGRTLLDEDQRAGAAPVVVIGHEEWQRRFEGDPNIIGRVVRLDGTLHTIVGVMPANFGFPVQHRYWTPLQVNGVSAERAANERLRVFARLADGFTMNQAQAELDIIGQRTAAAQRQTHEHLRPQLLPYTHAFVGIEGPGMELALRAVQLAVSLLLIVVAVNVAILVYARTTTRTGEIAVRCALGASRRRILSQLMMEALVLSVSATAIGLTIAGIALGMVRDFFMRATADTANAIAFWMDLRLSPGVIVYAAVLAVLAAVIMGVLPALKATGKRLQQGLQQFSARGSTLQLGRTWTVLIIVQVAIAAAAMPAAVNYAEKSLRIGTRPPADVADRLVRGTLVMTREGAVASGDSAADERATAARFDDRMQELMRRLEADPVVAAVTYADRFPGTEGWATMESDAANQNTDRFFGVHPNRIGVDLFETLEIPILAGRGFTPADAGVGATAVIVDQMFAEQLAGGGNVLGRRVRFAYPGEDVGKAGPWYDIVGVVPSFADDLTTPNTFDEPDPRIYLAGLPDAATSSALIVRVGNGAPVKALPLVRNVAASVDPTLRMERLETVRQSWELGQQAMWSMAVGIIAVMCSVLLLSAAGIYAMMSFTVNRRRREIGIRAALGADARRVLTGIFTRASAQLGIGIGTGLALAAAFEWIGPGGIMGDRALIILPGVAVILFVVGVLAALGPARRGLSVQPTEALRE